MKIFRTLFTRSQFATLGFLMTLSATSFAQTAPVKQWDKTFGGSDLESLRAIQQTADGGYILAGWSESGISGDKSHNAYGTYDYWVVKTNASGAKVWDKSFGGSAMDQIWSVQQTADGGYIIGGHSASGAGGDKTEPSKGNFDFWILKLDASGNKVWDKTIGGNGFDRIRVVKQTPDGGFILAGNSASGVSGDRTQPLKNGMDFWLVKLDASGTKTWDKSFGGINFQQLRTLELTSDGGFILGGQSESGVGNDKSEPTRGGLDYWIVRTDGSGNKLWDRTYGGTGLEDLLSIDQTTDGGFILGGFSDSNISGEKSEASKGLADYWMVRINATGNLIWDKTFGTTSADELFAIQQTADGGFILGGRTESGINGDKSENFYGYGGMWMLKTNAAGNKLWDKSFSGTDWDDFAFCQQTTDGGFILAGGSSSGIGGDKSEVCRGANDYWIVKTSAEILGTKEVELNANVSIFPNPSQGKFKLQLNEISSPKVEVIISDILGRKVLQKELPVNGNAVSEELETGNAKGMYLLQIKAGDNTISRKIVVE